MVSPATVAGDVVTKLRAIGTLATAIDAPFNTADPPVRVSTTLIKAYADDETTHRSLAEAIGAIATGEILVGYMGLGLGARGEISGWVHQIGIFWKPKSETQTSAIIAAIATGTPTGSSVALPYCQINTALDPMDDISFTRAANADGIEYWTCTFTLAEVWG